MCAKGTSSQPICQNVGPKNLPPKIINKIISLDFNKFYSSTNMTNIEASI